MFQNIVSTFPKHFTNPIVRSFLKPPASTQNHRSYKYDKCPMRVAELISSSLNSADAIVATGKFMEYIFTLLFLLKKKIPLSSFGDRASGAKSSIKVTESFSISWLPVTTGNAIPCTARNGCSSVDFKTISMPLWWFRGNSPLNYCGPKKVV